MRGPSSPVSRRRFLGTTISAAAGGLAATAIPRNAEAEQRLSPAPFDPATPPVDPDEAFWWEVRSQFNIKDGLTFMNNGTFGPPPRVVLDDHIRIQRELSEDPRNNYRSDELHENKAVFAEFFGAHAEDIAYMRSTTEGMNNFANGIDFREGDVVLMCTHEHPGGYGAYRSLEQHRGIEIHEIEIPILPESIDQVVDLYEKAITPRTRVIVVSHITFISGLLTPVKELSEMAHRHGLMISVDGAHPPGMMDLDFHDLGCDHYAAAGQKWLLAGTGTGLAYFSHDVQDRIHPLMGADGHEEDGVWVMHEDAERYEHCGQRNIPYTLGMKTAVEFQNKIGKANIEARVRQLSTQLKEGLQEIPGVRLQTPMDPKMSCGLTHFSIDGVPMDNVKQGIMDLGRIHIRTSSRGDVSGCRASTHFYNMPEEVDELLRCIRHIAEHPTDYV
ncbi:MAG: aminotransferase class V-fold PLP-dependent enzyme [Gemmatimonadetes bacterium]|nr:aminotransferase class V-fold PLP-dependent enzyme [Gemmatimonadota bacterium]NNM06899.1 aminotransferase class V-fold PLP-dependent enzyme [Gemmatimonadota bacterium]